MRHIPNILSGLRIVMVGVFVHFFHKGDYAASLCVYVLAVVTDILDGYLARHFDWTTNLGKVLDPLADKLMLIAALICFCVNRWIPVWLASIVITKELIMIAGSAVLYNRAIVVHADRIGKCATAFFNAGIITTLLKGFLHWIGRWNIALLCAAALLALMALAHYSIKNVYQHKDEFIKRKA